MELLTAVVEINDDQVQIMWLANKPGLGRWGHRGIVNYDSVPLTPGVVNQGAIKDSKALTRILKELHFTQTTRLTIPTYLLISSQQGFAKAFDLPWIAPKDRAEAIRFLVEEEVPISEEIVFDWQTLMDDRNDNVWRVLVGAGKRQLVAQFGQCLMEAGFLVKGVDFVDTALGLAISHSPSNTSHKKVLLIRASATGLYLGIFRGAAPELVRTLNVDYLVNKEEDELVGEIWRMVHYYSKSGQPGYSFSTIIVAGDSSAQVLGSKLAALGAAPTVELLEREQVDSAYQLRTDQFSIPAEMLGYIYKTHQRVMRLDIWRKMRQQIKNRYARQLALALTGIGILAGVGFSVFWWQTEIQLDSEIMVLAEQGTVTELQNRESSELQQAWSLITNNSGSTGRVLRDIQGLEKYGVAIEKIDYRVGSLSILGTAENYTAVENMLGALPSYGWESPLLTTYRQNEPNRIEFALTAQKKE